MSDRQGKREEDNEEEARTIHRWIAFSELLVPRRLRRAQRPSETNGRKGGEREDDRDDAPEP